MGYDELLTRNDAVRRVLDLRNAAVSGQSTEAVSLETIAGRTIAESVVADRDLPAQSIATMDGFAFDGSDEYTLRVVDEVFPEDDPPPIEAGKAVRIATGAPLPDGANAVLKREDAVIEGDQLSGEVIEPGTYVYQRGSNVEAGETLFRPGDRLAPKDAILLRDVGVERIAVHRRFSVAVLATGSEIHEGHSHDLDSPMLAGLVRSWGHHATIVGTVPDEYDRVENRIAELATDHDVVITTGGTSVGKKDHVVRALDALGDIRFHGVRIRPGKPIAVANLSDYDAVAFAIPGKPVGAHTIATAIARPFFTGETTLPTVDARLERDVDVSRPGFEYWVPVLLTDRADSDTSTPDIEHEEIKYDAMPLGHVDSSLRIYDRTFNPSVLSSSTRATRAHGFFVLESFASAGTNVRVVPYDAII